GPCQGLHSWLLGGRYREGHGELVAAEARDDRGRTDRLRKRLGDPPQKLIASIVAMLVVDHLEAMDLDRKQRDLVAASERVTRQLFRAVGESLAVFQPGNRVGRREDRCPMLTFGAPLRLVAKLEVSPPAKQDQRDVERKAARRNPDVCAKRVVGQAYVVKESAAVPHEQQHCGDDETEHEGVAVSIHRPGTLWVTREVRSQHGIVLNAKGLINLPAKRTFFGRRLQETSGADGGTRTRTPLRAEDFKSPAS